MTTKNAYARSGGYEDASGAGKRRKAKLAHRVAPAKKGTTLAVHTGVFTLSTTHYKHFEKCMTEPSSPTQAMEEAAKRIVEFSKTRR